MIGSTSSHNPSEEKGQGFSMVLQSHRVALGFVVGHLLNVTAKLVGRCKKLNI